MAHISSVAPLIEKLARDFALSEWEFIYLDTRIEVRASMTPSRLRNAYTHDLRVQMTTGARAVAFARALRATTFADSSGHGDLRYGFAVRDGSGVERAAVFMDRSGTYVSHDGHAYVARGPLAKWFRDLSSAVAAL